MEEALAGGGRALTEFGALAELGRGARIGVVKEVEALEAGRPSRLPPQGLGLQPAGRRSLRNAFSGPRDSG